MSIPSIEFFGLVLLLSAAFGLVDNKIGKKLILALFSATFLYTHIEDGLTLLILSGFVLSGFLAAKVLIRFPSKVILWTYLLGLLAAFLALKKYTYMQGVMPAAAFDHSFSIVGLSYILFRQIHFVVDAMERQIKTPSLSAYLHYQLNVFTLLSGPIQRYGAFESDWKSLGQVNANVHALRGNYFRILGGILCVLIVGDFFHAQYEEALKHPEWSRAFRGIVVFYSYPAYVYFNFSGFCNIVIGAGALFGLRIPENFNHPYRARNMVEFWNRWHITLSHWLRDYLFTPLYKVLAKGWPSRSASWAVASYFIVFLAAGVWHGSSLNFVVFGLLHGLGVSGAKLWETLIIRKSGRSGLKRYLASGRIRALAVAVNFHFACATFLFFPPGLGHCLKVLKAVYSGTLVA